MSALLEQRTPHQCVIATIAMATGRPYDEVLEGGLASGAYVEGEGCHSEQRVLEHLGLSHRYENGEPVGDFVCYHRQYAISPEFFRSLAWGRRAIITVPSLNTKGGHHSVYFDGRQVLDPNPPTRRRYTAFGDLTPSEMVLFRETAA